jgi:exosortase H (IPTLxxWG-CTERM-specific)
MSPGIQAARPSSSSRFLITFTLVALLGLALAVLPGIDSRLVVPLTEGFAGVAGHIVRLTGGSAEVTGITIRHASGFAIDIARRCAGLEAVIFLSAGMLAFPALGWERVVGVALGALALLTLNLGRIISLYILGQYSTTWFDWAHLYAWDALIMFPGLGVFLLWVRWLPSRRRAG